MQKKKKEIKFMKKNREKNSVNQKKAQNMNMVEKTFKNYKAIVNSKLNKDSLIAIPKPILADLKKVTIDSDQFCLIYNQRLRGRLKRYEGGFSHYDMDDPIRK